ncbi:MAG: cytochrome-c oxidase, cbb3-type subunit III [Gammaproteobacteria bacterium]
MSDFNSEFWSWFINAIVVIGIVWLLVLLRVNSKGKLSADGKAEATGHVWDGDLQELNTPLPRWWLFMFYITIVFGVAYLVIYPGMGSFKGIAGWTQLGQYEAEVAKADASFGPLYDKFLKQDIAVLAADDSAMKTGERLYVNYCAVCHGSDARGARGFPNLRDNDWLYGGEPENIKTTLMYGRVGAMPAWEGPLGGEEGVNQVANYVMGLSGRSVDEDLAAKGKEKYDMFCVGCHMPDGTGNQAIGAPNLANNIWLYGGTPSAVKHSIAKGRNGLMPAHGEFLGEAKVQVLAAYIYSLSHKAD